MSKLQGITPLENRPSQELLTMAMEWLQDIRTRWGERQVPEGEEASFIRQELTDLMGNHLEILLHRCPREFSYREEGKEDTPS
jgi:hypothetical protein